MVHNDSDTAAADDDNNEDSSGDYDGSGCYGETYNL